MEKKVKYYLEISTVLFLLLVLIPRFLPGFDNKKIAKESTITTDMIFVKGGTFLMGIDNEEDDEKPLHKVYVDDFYIDKHEVTNAQYCLFLNEIGNQKEGGTFWLDIADLDCNILKQAGKYMPVVGYDDHPIHEVTWYGAAAYAKWANKRLPTEAEWEHAARGGLKSNVYDYSGSNDADSVAWYEKNSEEAAHPVGEKKYNEIGIHDMSGNVWEWCADWYRKDYYEKSPFENPTGPSDGFYRVLRGGSWGSEKYDLRCANRHYSIPKESFNNIGFRCVVSGVEVEKILKEKK